MITYYLTRSIHHYWNSNINGKRSPGRSYVRLSFQCLTITQVLRDVFGHKTFRLSQEAVKISIQLFVCKDAHILIQSSQVIKRLLVDGENALVLYPTGGTHILRQRLFAFHEGKQVGRV